MSTAAPKMASPSNTDSESTLAGSEGRSQGQPLPSIPGFVSGISHQGNDYSAPGEINF